MNYRTSGKPLDFSFMKIQKVTQLKKEKARGGLQKDPVQSDDEDDTKKNENGGGQASEENAAEEQKTAEPKEKVIRAPQTQ